MRTTLALALYDDRGDVVPIASWRTPTERDLASSTLVVDDDSSAFSEWNFGNLGLVAVQIEAAADEIAAGGTALVRSAIDDADELPYLVFRPRGADVLVTLDVAGELLPTTTVVFDRGDLVAAMHADAERARRLHDSAGVRWPTLDEALDRTASVRVHPRGNTIEERLSMRVPAASSRLGVDPAEAEALAEALTAREERDHEPGLAGFRPFDREGTLARARRELAPAIGSRSVRVAAFEIDVCPVTDSQWAVDARKLGSTGAIVDGDGFVLVTANEATTYARRHGLALPTEAEHAVAERHAPRAFDAIERAGEHCEGGLIRGGNVASLHAARASSPDERARFRCVRRGA